MNPVDHPAVLLPDIAFLLNGDFHRDGFDLVITLADGQTFIVHDYFAFQPPPLLTVEGYDVALTPEMVASFLPAGLAGVMFAGPATSGAVLEEIGTVRFVRGDVTITRADGTEVQATRGMPVYKGDAIETGSRSFINIRFNDGVGAKSTRFNLGANASASLDDFSYEPDQQVGRFETTVRAGGFKFKSGGIGTFGSAQRHTTIKTPSAVIGVRGSELEGSVDPLTGQTIIVHRSGVLDVTDVLGNNPQTLDEPGETSIITLGDAPTLLPQLPPDVQQILQQFLPPQASVEVDEQIDAEEAEDTTEQTVGAEDENREEENEEDASGTEETEESDNTDEAAEETRDEAEEDTDADDESDEDETAEDENAEETERTDGDSTEETESPDGETGNPATENTGSENNDGTSEGTDPNADPVSPTTDGSDDESGATRVSTDTDTGTDFGADDTRDSLTTTEGDNSSSTNTGNETDPTTRTPTNNTQNPTNTRDDPVRETEIPPNNAPVAADDVFSIDEDSSLQATSVLANDADPEGGALRVNPTPVRAPSHGELNLRADGTFSYRPNEDFAGTDSFVYRAVDSAGGVDAATVTINVRGLPDAPTARADAYDLLEDAELEVPASDGVVANDIDPDGDPLTVNPTPVEDVAHGTLILTETGAFRYVPDAEFTGVDSFVYEIRDGQGGVSSARVTLRVEPVNDVPMAVADSSTTNEDAILTVLAETGLLSNDTDPEGSPLSVVAAQGNPELVGIRFDLESGASAAVTSTGAFVYDPGDAFDYLSNGEFAEDFFEYTVADAGGATSVGRVTITVSGLDDAPVAERDLFETGENTSVIRSAEDGLLANDRDPDRADEGRLEVVGVNGDSAQISPPIDNTDLTPVVVRLDSGANVAVRADGSFQYDPLHAFNHLDDGETAVDSFTYTVADPGGLQTTQFARISLMGENDGPTAGQDVYEILSDETLSPGIEAGLLANDADPEGHSFALTTTPVVDVEHGTLQIFDDGSFEYVPDAGFTGTDSFVYQITDISGASSNGNALIRVGVDNIGPIAGDDSYVVTQGTTFEIAAADGVLANDSDPDGDALSAEIVTSAVHGILVLSADGAFSYTPEPSFVGFDTFTYQVSDGSGGIADASVTLEVSPNAPPVVTAPVLVHVSQDDPVTDVDLLANSSDDNSDPLSVVSVVTSGDASGIVISGSTATVDPAAYSGLSDGQTETIVVTYQVTDGATPADTSATIVVTGANDAPTTAPASVTTPANTPTNVDVSVHVSDPDVGDLLTFSLVTGVANGSLAIGAGGVFSYSPNLGFAGVDSFDYRVTDSAGDTAVGTINVTVLPEPLSAGSDLYTVAEDANLNIPVGTGVLANDIGSGLTVAGSTTPAHGTAVVNADGSFTYIPSSDYNGSDSFQYTLQDSIGQSVTGLVTITVTPVQDAPTSVADVGAVSATGTTTFNLLGNDSDADLDLINVVSVESGVTPSVPFAVTSGALVTFETSGSIIYDPNGAFDALAPGATSVDSFSYVVTDGIDTTSATISITVTGVNDAPTVTVPGAQVVNEDASILFTGGLAIGASDIDGSISSVQVTALNGTLSATGPAAISGDSTSSIMMSGSQADVLATLASLSYMPTPDYFGADTIIVVASDDLAATGSDTIPVTVSPINDSPVFGGLNLLSPVTIGDANPAGQSIGSALLGSSDIDGSIAGFAVIGIQDNSVSDGVWEYSSDGGTTWTAIPLTVDDAGSALALDASSFIRFIPAVSTIQSSALGLDVRLLDDTYSSFSDSTIPNDVLVDTSVTGGDSGVSTASHSFSLNLDNATLTTIGAGTFSTPGIWDLGAVPDSNDAVVIDHTVTNTATATIVDLTVNSTGDLQLDGDLTSNGSVQVSSGVLRVSAARTLTLAGGGNFTNTMGTLAGLGSFNLLAASTVINDGAIDPGNTTTLTGTLTISTGNLQQTTNSALNIETLANGSNDTLAVSGNYEIDGTLNLDFLGTEANGDSYTIVTFASSTGSQFSTVNATNLDAGLSYSIQYNSTDITVTIQPAIADFDGDVDGDWNTAANWVGDVVPMSGYNVVIDGFAVDYSSGTSDVASLNLTNSASLTISGGDLTLTGEAGSVIDASSSLSILPGGTFASTTTGTSTLVVNGALDVAGTTTLIQTLDNGGTVTIDNGAANANGVFTTDGITNQAGALFVLDNASTGNHRGQIIQNGPAFQNAGTFQSLDTGGGMTATTYHLVNGSFTNQATGTLDVDANLQFDNAIMDLSAGTVDVAAGAELLFSGGSTVDWGASNLTGAGVVNVTSGGTMTFNNSFALTASTPTFDLGNSAVNLTGTGTLTIGSGADLRLSDTDSVNVPLVVSAGVLSAEGGSNTVGGTVTLNAAGAIEVHAINGANGSLTVAAGFVNDGLVLLEQSGTQTENATLVISGAPVLTNNGTFQTNNVGGAAAVQHQFGGDLVNGVGGVIDINESLFLQFGSSLDAANGALDVLTGKTLTLSSSSLTVGAGTALSGAGTIAFTGTGGIALASAFSLGASTPEFDLSAGTVSITGTGPFDIESGKDFTLNGSDSIAATIQTNVSGVLDAQQSGNAVDGTLLINPAGSLGVIGTDAANAALTVMNAFINDGEILLDSTATASSNNATLTVSSGSITNNGVFVSEYTGSGFTPEHSFSGTLVNGASGIVDIHQNTRFVSGSALDVSNGSLYVDGNAYLLLVGSSLSLGSGTTLGGVGTISFSSGGTLNLSGVVSLGSDAPVFDFSNTNVTATGTGTLTIPSDREVELNAGEILNVDLDIEGRLVIKGATNQLNDSITLDPTGKLEILAVSGANADVTLPTGFTNNGIILLDNQDNTSDHSTLTLTGGVILNNGTFSSLNTAGGTGVHQINGDLGGTGAFEFATDTIFLSGHVLDAGSASLDVHSGATLTFTAGTLRLGSGTLLSSDGTFNFTGVSTVDLTGNVTLDHNSPTFELSNGDVTFTATSVQTLTLAESATLSLSVNDTITVPTTSNGVIHVLGANNSIDGSFVMGASGVLELQADATNAVLDLANNFTNAGTVIFDELSNTTNAATLTVNSGTGTFINNGELFSKASLGGNKTNTLSATLTNNSYIEVAESLAVSSSGAHQNNASIHIDAGETLSVSGTSFVSSSAGVITGTGVLDETGLSGAFTNNGTLDPGTDSTIGTLSITGDVDQNSTATLVIDVQSVATHDQLVVSGAYDLVGSYDIRFQSNPGVSSFTIVNAGSVTVAGGTSVIHNLSGGYSVSLGTTTSTVSVNIVADGFELTSIGNGLFSTTTPWGGGPPISTDDVRIVNTDVVDYTSTVTQTVNSVSVEDTATLDVQGNQLTLTDVSRTNAGTTLAFSQGGFVVNNLLTVDGQFNWTGGVLSGSGNVVVNGQATIDLGNTHTLNTTLELHGTSTIIPQVSPKTLTGTGSIDNHGNLTIEDQVTVNPLFSNQVGGVAIFQANGSNAIFTLADTGSLVNDGVLALNNSEAVSRNVTLNISSAMVTNHGTIEFNNTGGGGGNRVLDTAAGSTLLHNGTIDVNHSGEIDIAGLAELDAENGKFDVLGGTVLTLEGNTGGTLKLGTNTDFTGTGTISLSGSMTVTIDAFLDLKHVSITSNGASATTIQDDAGLSDLVISSSLELDSNDAISSNVSTVIKSGGELILSGGDVDVNGQVFVEPGGQLILTGSVGGAQSKSFAFPINNEGSMTFDVASTGVADFNRLEFSGTFTNVGTFTVTDSGLASTAHNIVLGTFVNQGAVNIEHSLEFGNTGTTVHSNTGTMVIDTGQTLVLATGNDFENSPDGQIKGHGSISVSSTTLFKNSGTISPGDTSTAIGTFNISNTGTGATTFTQLSTLEIEVDGTNGAGVVGGHDQLTVQGAFTERGRINVTTNYAPTVADSVIIVSVMGGFLGGFDEIAGRDVSSSIVWDAEEMVSATETLALTAVAVDNTGTFTAGTDIIAGTGGADVLLGGDGNDQITGLGMDDIAFGQGGDDYMEVDTNIATVDGGSGVDTLVMTDMTQDLTSDGYGFVGYSIENFEIWSLRDAPGAQTLTLDMGAIYAVVDGANDLTGINNSLVVIGSVGDKVVLDGDFMSNGTAFHDAGDGNEEFKIFTHIEGNVSLYLDQHTELEVLRTDGSVIRYGGSGDDVLLGVNAKADELDGRIGNDTLDYEVGDTLVDGGTGLDTAILLEDSIDLSGVVNLVNIERLDMENGGSDTLNLNVADILDIVGDNQLDILGVGESGATDGYQKILIDGDMTDVLNLEGFDMTAISGNATPTGFTSTYTPFDALGDSEMYISFIDTSNMVEVLVHTNLVDDDPLL